MKKFLSLILAAVLALSVSIALADEITIAVPNDPTNEGRALLLLQSYGIIKLDPEAGITATAADVVETPWASFSMRSRLRWFPTSWLTWTTPSSTTTSPWTSA